MKRLGLSRKIPRRLSRFAGRGNPPGEKARAKKTNFAQYRARRRFDAALDWDLMEMFGWAGARTIGGSMGVDVDAYGPWQLPLLYWALHTGPMVTRHILEKARVCGVDLVLDKEPMDVISLRHLQHLPRVSNVPSPLMFAGWMVSETRALPELKNRTGDDELMGETPRLLLELCHRHSRRQAALAVLGHVLDECVEVNLQGVVELVLKKNDVGVWKWFESRGISFERQKWPVVYSGTPMKALEFLHAMPLASVAWLVERGWIVEGFSSEFVIRNLSCCGIQACFEGLRFVRKNPVLSIEELSRFGFDFFGKKSFSENAGFYFLAGEVGDLLNSRENLKNILLMARKFREIGLSADFVDHAGCGVFHLCAWMREPRKVEPWQEKAVFSLFGFLERSGANPDISSNAGQSPMGQAMLFPRRGGRQRFFEKWYHQKKSRQATRFLEESLPLGAGQQSGRSRL